MGGIFPIHTETFKIKKKHKDTLPLVTISKPKDANIIVGFVVYV